MSAPTFARISYSIEEAAAAVGVSERTIRDAINASALVAHYAGARAGKALIRSSDLDEWVESLPTERRSR